MFGAIRRGGGVLKRVRGMGGAFVGVLSAELSALVADLSASGRSLVRSLLLFAAGFAFAFWTLGLAVYFMVELLALALPRWGAVGIVFGLFLLVAALLVRASLARLRGIESPAATVDRRLQGHLGWWRQRIAASEPGAARRAASDEPDDELDDDEEFP